MYKRKCPECDKEIAYKSKNAFGVASRQLRVCKTCSQKDSVDDFITKARRIHGDKYDYRLVKSFKNEAEKVSIICPVHGVFSQTIHDHKQGGCYSCRNQQISKRFSYSTGDFIEQARKLHGETYNYNKVQYTRNRSKICIGCSKHGDFWQLPDNHLSKKSGCPQCAIDSRFYTQEEFLQKSNSIHGNLYDYSPVGYERSDRKVEIICRKHGIFWQSPENHLLGKGCQRCIRKEEARVEGLLREHFPEWEIATQEKIYSPAHGRYRYFDFVLKKNGYTIIVEYDGKQHFQPVRFSYKMTQEKAETIFKLQQITDLLDAKFCKNNGFILHRIKYGNKEEAILKLVDIVTDVTVFEK